MNEMLDDIIVNLPIFNQKILASKDFHNKQTSTAYYQILGVLEDRGNLPISVIGDLLYISRPNMTSHIDKLVSDGMVERRPDENDRRIINIHITPAGKDFIHKSRVKVEENILKNLTCLNNEELEELYEAIQIIKKVLLKIQRN